MNAHLTNRSQAVPFVILWSTCTCDIILQNLLFDDEMERGVLRACLYKKKNQIASTTESEDGYVRLLAKSHTNLSYLLLVPNCMEQC